jgi:hypothetical protein
MRDGLEWATFAAEAAMCGVADYVMRAPFRLLTEALIQPAIEAALQAPVVDAEGAEEAIPSLR